MQVQTNFFTALAQILGNSTDLTLTIRRQDEKLVVGVRPQRQKKDSEDKIEVLSNIRPLVMTHAAADLDANFFETVTAAVEAYDAGLSEIESYKAEIKKETEKAKDKADKKSTSSTSSTTKKSKSGFKPKSKGKAKPAPPKSEVKVSATAEADIKAYVATATDNITKLPKRSLDEIEKGYKLLDKVEQPLRAQLEKQLLELKARAEAEIKALELKQAMKKVEPLFKKAEALIKALNFGDGGVALGQVLGQVPEHEGALAIVADLKERLGEDSVKNLVKIPTKK